MLVVRKSGFAQWPNSVWRVVNTCPEVGGLRGRERPSFVSSAESVTMVLSEKLVVEDDIDRAGVDVDDEELRERARAKASACERAVR